MRSPLRHFDWDLRSCGWHGHITYQPSEAGLAERLVTTTPAGEAWRCLRCETFVPGPPLGTGPAAEAPLVLRGRGLRDAFILRILAVERLVRGLLLLALAYGIYQFNGSRDALQQVFSEYLPTLQPIADKLNVDLDHAGPVRLIEWALALRHSTLTWVAVGILGYAVLQLTEATGLWLMKRWGEYVAVVGTGVFIPLEVYELVERVTWLRIFALLVNVAAVVYILWTKRLFGIRGGHAAFEAERRGDSLLEVEQAALAVPDQDATPDRDEARHGRTSSSATSGITAS